MEYGHETDREANAWSLLLFIGLCMWGFGFLYAAVNGIPLVPEADCACTQCEEK